jgi:hypothetical protein
MLLLSFPRPLDRRRLQNSLTQVVARFPWLWSHVEETADGGSCRLSPCDEPVLLEDGNVGAFDGEKTGFVRALGTAAGSPLARFCLTETSSGSLLGVRISHVVGDGASFYHFLVSWAQVTRGEPMVDPVRLPIAYDSDASDDPSAEQILSDCGLFVAGAREIVPSESLKVDSVYLSPADVESLRERAQRDSQTKLTTNDVLTAYTWQKYGSQWALAAGEPESFLSCAVDMRALTNLPWNHFGCAIGLAVTRMDTDQLRRASLGELAILVRQAVKSITADSFPRANATLDRVRRAHGLAAVQKLHIRHPRAGTIISNLTRAPIPQLDFGSGIPSVLAADSAVYDAATFYTYPGGIHLRLLKHA